VVVRAVEAIGGGQAISIDWDRGVLTGGSDPPKRLLGATSSPSLSATNPVQTVRPMSY
jgi:hypothetical protein